MKKILVIDNYDSFVYNLVHYLKMSDCHVQVIRNDALILEEIEAYDKILLSPGPGIPQEAGLLQKAIEKYAPTKSILGVCLGQQAIAEVFGGSLSNLNTVLHGVGTEVQQVVEDEWLFDTLPRTFTVGRYHSWTVDPLLPDCLEVTTVDHQHQVMSLRHKEFDVRSVQFHPESILTPFGKIMVKNWAEH